MPTGKSLPIACQGSLHQQRRNVDVLAEKALRNDAFRTGVLGSPVAYSSLSQGHAAHGLIDDKRVEAHQRAVPARVTLWWCIDAAESNVCAVFSIAKDEGAARYRLSDPANDLC